MQNNTLNTLKTITLTTLDREKRTYSLWLILTYHVKSLTTDELFSFVPFIWKVDIANMKFFSIRQKIEREIKERQNTNTILKLLELLQNDNPYLRFFGADLLNDFQDERIIDPLLDYLYHTNDDFITKRQAICALRPYKNDKIKQFLQEEFEKNKTNQDTFFKNNYLSVIEWLLND